MISQAGRRVCRRFIALRCRTLVLGLGLPMGLTGAVTPLAAQVTTAATDTVLLRSGDRIARSFVGGSGTLHTFQVAAFQGDRVAFVGTKYTIPLPAFTTLPLLGRPGLDLLHYAAMAWSRNEHRNLEQNVGLRLGYKILYLRVLTDPAEFGDVVKTSIGVTFPRKSYPWEAPGPPPKK